jgi:hypothetical protein
MDAETFYLGSWAGQISTLARELGASEVAIKNWRVKDCTAFVVILTAEKILELYHDYDVMITTRSEHTSRKQKKTGVVPKTWRNLWVDTKRSRFAVH